MYVVVAVRLDRASEPDVALAPAHPPDAVQVDTFVVDQFNVTPPPLTTVAGDAASEIVGGGSAVTGSTVTLTDCVTEPPPPVQVSANDEFDVKAPVVALPAVALAPPQFPEAVHAEALVEDQTRVAEAPAIRTDGDTDSDTEGPGGAVGGCVTFAVTVWPAVPPAPAQVSV